MTRMSKGENIEPNEQEVYRWLKKRREWGFTEENYENLSPSNKNMLHNVLRIPTYITDYEQRRNLFMNLSAPEAMRIISLANLGDLIPPDEQLRKIFSRLTPAERLHDLYKY